MHFFEDDIEASPFYFAWAKWAILMYRYGPDSRRQTAQKLFGVSLIQQKTSELDRATGRILWSASDILGHIKVFDSTSPYLSQVPSSWGAVYFPEVWREFHDYIQIRDTEQLIELNYGNGHAQCRFRRLGRELETVPDRAHLPEGLHHDVSRIQGFYLTFNKSRRARDCEYIEATMEPLRLIMKRISLALAHRSQEASSAQSSPRAAIDADK